MIVVAVTQARYGSKRLPAKVLKKVGDKTLLDIHIQRILKSKMISKLIVATTNEKGAERIIDIANRNGVESFCGSVNNVLERFYFAVKDIHPDYVVRITSDCPLIDSKIIDEIINICILSKVDYVSNTLKPTYPDGLDCEVFKFDALKKAYFEAKLKSEIEHVTPYIKKNSTFYNKTLFTSLNYENEVDYSKYRITVDTQEDYDLIKILIGTLGTDKDWLTYIKYIEKNPNLLQINNKYSRDEGYKKSLLED